ncbi:IPT/TIG domain-containing protein [Paraburkholderia sp. SIMBA_054]|uniref:IPT/TIG domain-containing protein n=2 Tax=unclassified Paraburkholderia TaxID=2615204 RepID=UPI00397BFE1E
MEGHNLSSEVLRDEIIKIGGELSKLYEWLKTYVPLLTGPDITSFTPSAGYGGSLIEINGHGFAEKREDNTVTIGGKAARVITATDSQLRVIAPPDVVTGPIGLTVGLKTVSGPYLFTLPPYPKAGDETDGPPIEFEGHGQGQAGDQPSTGKLRVAVALVNPADKVPADPAGARTAVVDAWNNVHTFYDQQSYTRLNVAVDVTPNWKTITGNTSDYLNSAGDNIDGTQVARLAAECAQACVDAGLKLDDYGMLACVIFLDGHFIRAWGNLSTQLFSYNNGSTHIDISTANEINYIEIQESANWGRFAHETGHNISAAPSFTQSDDETATLGEDVYSSDLVDPLAASAQDFEIMGNHDQHPGFCAYHHDKLGWCDGTNILDLQWDRNPFQQDYQLVAHGLTQNAAGGRYHMLRIRVSSGLFYYVEVRQRPPAASGQVFDPNIPLGGSPRDGGVVVYKILTDVNNTNQQWRYVTLLHDDQVLATGGVASDPARALTITVLDDNVASSPRVCSVRVAWAQAISDDPSGAFDLRVDPWDSNYQTPDIWVDRMPFGSFDQPNDSQGRPQGNGDKPRPHEINHLFGRVHCDGSAGATNVRVTYYAVDPPGVGDNGNWTPLKTTVIPNISAGAFVDTFVNWVPAIGQHTCLKIYAEEQLGEITGGNNFAQENVLDFEAPASSVPDAVLIPVAVRNPKKDRRQIHISLAGVPRGYRVQFPHQWVWLDGLEEKTFNLAVIPTVDYMMYVGKERQVPRRADVRIRGGVAYNYQIPLGGGVPPTRISPIGGITARVSPKRRVEVMIEEDREHSTGDTIGFNGHIAPSVPDQRIRVDLTDPAHRLRVALAKTDASGIFRVRFDLTQPPNGGATTKVGAKEKPLPGQYLCVASVLNSPDAAEATSNTVVTMR